MAELFQSPWGHVFGERVLVRDSNNMTAYISIAQAAVAQLGNLVFLLESIISAVDKSIRRHDGDIRELYEFEWKTHDAVNKTHAAFCKVSPKHWI